MWIGLEEPAPRCNAIGLVVKLGGPKFGEVPQHFRFKQFGVELGHTIHRRGSHDGQMGHPDVFRSVLLNDAHAAQAVPSSGYREATSRMNRALIS